MIAEDVIAGDRVRLNNNAREAFRGKVLLVDEVRAWGVCCHYDTQDGAVYYRAEWNEIQGILT